MFRRLVAGALVAGGGAAEEVLADLDVAATADPALGEPGHQVARPLPRPEGPVVGDVGPRIAGHRGLPRLHPIPQILRDDPQLRHLLDDVLGRIVEPRDPLAGPRVLHILQAVPDQAADIELVVEDARAAGGVAVDGRGAPAGALRAVDSLLVESEGNPAGRLAIGELGEDAQHDRGLDRR